MNRHDPLNTPTRTLRAEGRSEPDFPTALRLRSTTFYRTVLALPLLALIALFASGRAQAYWTLVFLPFTDPGRAPSLAGFGTAFATGALWLAANIPLMFASWELGSSTPRRDG